MGWKNDPPEEYLLIRAARYLGVAPWDLEDRAILWRNLALACESAEHEAEAEALKLRGRR
jgi:hypothetical protein